MMRLHYNVSIVAMLCCWSLSISSFSNENKALKLSGVLAAMPCSNKGNIDIGGENSRVSSGQLVSCASSGGEIRLSDFSVEEGGIFSAKAFADSDSLDDNQLTQWADTGCTTGGILGSVDCNSCANNVQQQFDTLFSDEVIRSEGYWKLKQKKDYPPSGRNPKNVFKPGRIHATKHIQGFVKIESGLYAGTYSGNAKALAGIIQENKGSIFFIDYDSANERLTLDGLHNSWHNHPSGMAAVGKHVVWADPRNNNPNGKDLRVINTDLGNYRNPSENSLLISHWRMNDEDKSFSAGGGLGVVKLNSGGYLLIATHPGGPTIDKEVDLEFDTFSPDNPPKKTDFFYVEGKLNASGTELKKFGSDITKDHYLNMSVEHLGRWTQDQFAPNAKQSKYQYSENLTAISECGSGDIYVIHTSSTKPWKVRQERVPGYWRLSKVVWGASGPSLDILKVYEEGQSFGGCLHRAAATAWVNPNDHEIELYCSEYRLDNNIKRKEEDLHFKTRAIGQKAKL